MKSCTEWFLKYALILIFLLQLLPFCISLEFDAIKLDHPIKDGDVLISTRKTFTLGFFSPGSSRNRYIGIWYNKVPESTFIWVANRDNPVNDKSGVLAVNGHGGLVIYGHHQNQSSDPLWSANVSVPQPNPNTSFTAKLFDGGNLVLLQINTTHQTVIWQSFDHPTDTLLPFMKLGLNRGSGLDRFLTSWKSADDPGTGNFSLRIDPSGVPQVFLYQGRVRRWRGGSWTGLKLTGVPEMTPKFIFNVSFVNNQDEVFITYGILNDSISSRMVIEESGTLRRSTWQDRVNKWVEFWSAPDGWCDVFGRCGGNGICDPSDASKFACACLPGFEPRSPVNWDLRDGSGGCVRKRGAGGTCGNSEGFVKMVRVKLPDTSNARVGMGLSLKACEQQCLKDCNCTAYTSTNESRGGDGCLMWHGDLIDVRTYSTAGQDLYIRVDSITLAEYPNKSNGSISKKKKLAISLCSVVVLFLLVSIAYWLAKRRRKVKQRQSRNLFVPSRLTYSEDYHCKKELDEGSKDSDIPLFDLKTIVAATCNFSIDYKLGQGGFGSVYKGILPNGKEIAVKRLSKYSSQGIEEFKNEVILLVKLQHRNLVRILGCCFQEEEKMLIYEYLPNKSLDSFIFDETRRKELDWRKRFDIICGIARGILYLHQDSRLRIIHRDIKASNVLLDAAMNPKIADFGLARIFGGDQIEASTKRVIGTYGYMSPEYVMKGLFSIKSDVYSFGILLLEIITGQKNIHYYQKNLDSNLVGHVWDLWRAGKAFEIVDSSLDETFNDEALRCIQIGLLCVQEDPTDRPTMSTVVFMLGNEAALPSPKQPAFIFKTSTNCTSRDPSTSYEVANSINFVTCTMADGR